VIEQKVPAEKISWWKTSRAKKTINICIFIAIVGAVAWWFLFFPYVSTDDARVAATLVRIAPDGVSGRIEKLNATEGTRVKKDDVLIELDHRTSDANLERAQSRADLATEDLKRSQSLARQSGIALRDLDKALADSRASDGELKLAEAARDNTTLKSPIDGVVVQKMAEIGNILEAGQTALTVADVDHAWIAANIEETSISRVKLGQPVTITVDEGGSLTGKVSEIREAAAAQFALIPSDNAAGNFTKLVQRIPIKIELDDHSGRILRPGQSVEIKIRVR
jgi:RND family efflux transporter MFP subunit